MQKIVNFKLKLKCNIMSTEPPAYWVQSDGNVGKSAVSDCCFYLFISLNFTTQLSQLLLVFKFNQ